MPEEPQSTSDTPKTLLPGMALIAIYMLIVAMTGAFSALRGLYPPTASYIFLPVCTLIILGVFGLLRLRRWGWALVNGGCLSMALWYIYVSRITHDPRLLVMAAFDFCFFLYLSRTEVRDRLKSSK